ncbi:condensation domain-containing protein [Streptomyces sp. NPDC047017]|uniref:condensation domain-containing protein n=1 Tax=Streptomyces sp. NPDC047017 TaxID=3155024 RepID=UPI0033EFD056
MNDTRWAPMLWGQEHYWFLYFDVPAYGADRDCVKITRVWRLDKDVPDDTVLAALTALVRQYESLRTNFLQDDRGRPVQAVRPPWEVAFEERTEGDASDLPAVTERLAARAIDPARDRPVRFALINEPGKGAWVVAMAMHSAIDGQSWAVLERAFLALMDTEGGAPPFPPARQPREQAELDHSADKARYRERVRAYWRDRYRTIPQGMFPDYRPAPVGHFDGHTPPSPYERVTLKSRALSFAAERVAARRKMSPGVVYLAAFGAALSSLSGSKRCVVSMDTANRADPLLSAAVGCFFQPALVVFDVMAQDTSEALLTKVFRAVVAAQRHARYSTLEMTEERARVGHERGMHLRIGVTYNYFAQARPEHRAAPPGRLDGAGTTDDFTIEKAPIDWQDNSADLYLAVETGEDGVVLSMHGHTSVTDGDRIARALRAMGALIAGWADGTLPLDTAIGPVREQLGFPRRAFGPDWVLVDHAWVNTRECAARLAELGAVTVAGVFPEETPDGGTRLVAYAVGPTTPDELRGHLSAAQAGRPSLVLPHRYVVCAQAPRTLSAESWAEAEVVAEGDGFPSRPVPPRTPRERALAAAVRTHCPGHPADMATPYLPAGGRTALAPRVTDHLHAAGFTGIVPADLLGPLPLGAVAAKLIPTGTARKR